MAWYKKLWNGIKKVGKYVAPVAAAAAPFVFPSIGSAISGGISKIGGWLSGGSSAALPPVDDGTSAPNPNQVPVTGQRAPFDWGGLAEKVIPGFMGAYGQHQQNSAQAAQAQKQMDFQAQQTGSSYQRGVADMKAAGLNPMLAYSQGGAASGGGAQAQIGNEIGAGLASAQSVAMTKANLEQINASTIQTDEQTRNTAANTDLQIQQRALASATTESERQRIRQIIADTDRLELRNVVDRALQTAHISQGNSAAQYWRHHEAREGNLEKASKYDLSQAREQSRFYDKWGSTYLPAKAAAEVTNSATSALSNLNPFGKIKLGR